MARSRERLIELMLEEAHGNPPPDLSRRIMRSLDQPVPASSPVAEAVQPRGAVLRPAFPWHWFAAAAAAAVLLGAGLALVFSGKDTPAPQPEIATPGTNVPVQPAPAPAPKPAPRPEPAPQPEPRVQPRPQPEPETPQPEPRPVPQPQPEPEPEPQPAPRPPEEVERPAPEPEAPKPGPTPEEPKPAPGPVVDDTPKGPAPQPVPERPPTEAPRTGPVRVALVMYQSANARLSYKEAGAARFTEVKGDLELMSGWTLSARHPVLLDLGQGKRAWFEGELGLDVVEGNPVLEVIKEGVFVDALGAKGAITIRREGTSIEVSDAAVLAERMSTVKDGLEISCLDGEVVWGESRLNAGQGATISGRGFKRTKAEGARLREKTLFKDWARAQNLVREDFDGRMGERLYAGEIENGVVIGPGGREVSVGCYLPQPREAGERTYVRVRMRVTAHTGLYVQVIGDDGKARYGKEFLVPAGQWVTLKFPVLANREGDNGMRGVQKPPEKPEPGAKDAREKDAKDAREKDARGNAEKSEGNGLLVKFQVLTKVKGTQIEIDWVEIGDELPGK
ncbi:MAG: hypothetical protein HS108_11485 [Planctomycetes bacterium]|nr:hypothetical protein [Planctomycetota bacterium]MCL4730035.1 hypothetical protein [Planctomycetota bacterium]